MNFSWERAPIAGSAISAILPAYQVEQTLTEMLGAIDATFRGLRRKYELIIVDDGSTDGTANAAEAFAGGQPLARLLRHEHSLGYGAALRTGLQAAIHPLVFTMPADGCFDSADLNGFLTLINHVDAVCGYRRTYPWLKRQFQSWSSFKYFGLWFKDPVCPMRLYRRNMFERIPIQSNGRFADVEILAKANFLGCLLAEREISWQSTCQPAGGPSPLGDAWRVFRRPDFGPAAKLA